MLCCFAIAKRGPGTYFISLREAFHNVDVLNKCPVDSWYVWTQILTGAKLGYNTPQAQSFLK